MMMASTKNPGTISINWNNGPSMPKVCHSTCYNCKQQSDIGILEEPGV